MHGDNFGDKVAPSTRIHCKELFTELLIVECYEEELQYSVNCTFHRRSRATGLS